MEPTSRALGEFKVQVLEALLRVVSALGAGSSVWMLVASPVPFRRALIMVVLFSPVHILAWVPRLGPRVRSVGLIAALGATTVAISLSTGPSFGAGIACATLCVLAGLLHGRVLGLLLYASFGAFFILGGVLLQAGYLPRPSPADPTQMAGWLTAGVNFLVIVGMLLTSVLFVVERIEMALREERATLYRFEQERRDRVRAEEALEVAEEALRRAQMVEAAGKLAGGVAHDFNNSLMVIHGWVDLLRLGNLDAKETDAALESISRATTSCSELTTRLLTLGRRDVRKPLLLEPSEVLESERRSLRAIMPENIDISVEVDWAAPIYADPSQVQQLLLNLCLNARDAMPNGGRLSIRVLPGEEDDDSGRAGTLIEVSDDGVGMEPAIQERLFEPFFTTKPAGQGTGLGLATTYAIVHDAGGTIRLQSALGEGSTFDVFLPRAAAADPEPTRRETPVGGMPVARAGETLLLAEDEPAIREALARMLRAAGFTVIEASNGGEALRRAEETPGRIDLLLTDVMMPGVGGKELVQRLRSVRPETRVILMSGYTDDEALRTELGDARHVFLQKPFAARKAVTAVRELLDAP